MNWLTSEAAALSFQGIGYITILEGIKDTRKVIAEPWYDPIKTPYYVDFEIWEKNFDKDMDFWVKTIMEGR